MHRLALSARLDGLREAMNQAASIQPQVILLFAAPAIWQERAAISEACEPYKNIHLLGCSTAGEISTAGASDGTCSILAMRLERGEVKVAAAQLGSADASRAAGKSIGEALKESRLRGVFALTPGLQVDGSAFASGVAGVVGDKVTVAGGLAGDGLNFKSTVTMLNGMIFPNLAVAFGVYGETVSMTSRLRSGWKPFGLARRVTKSAGNVLRELDGKPPLELYRKYLGGAAAHMPASGLMYPFSLLREDGTETGLVRGVLQVSAADGSVILSGDVPQGSLVRLMYADPDLLVDGAASAAKEAVNGHKGPSAALIVSCAGRRLAMGDDANSEVSAALKNAGDSACAGFYAYGEIAPVMGPSRADVQSQSIAVTHIAEDAP